MRIVVYFFLLTLLAGCHKDERVRYSVAGAWEITSLEMAEFHDGAETRRRVVNEAGTFLLSDNRAEYDNHCVWKFETECPRSIVEFANDIGADTTNGHVYWYPGPSGRERLTLWAEGPIHDIFVLYTVAEITQSSMTLSYVLPDNEGRIQYKETWKLER